MKRTTFEKAKADFAWCNTKYHTILDLIRRCLWSDGLGRVEGHGQASGCVVGQQDKTQEVVSVTVKLIYSLKLQERGCSSGVDHSTGGREVIRSTPVIPCA